MEISYSEIFLFQSRQSLGMLLSTYRGGSFKDVVGDIKVLKRGLLWRRWEQLSACKPPFQEFSSVSTSPVMEITTFSNTPAQVNPFTCLHHESFKVDKELKKTPTIENKTRQLQNQLSCQVEKMSVKAIELVGRNKFLGCTKQLSCWGLYKAARAERGKSNFARTFIFGYEWTYHHPPCTKRC